LENLFKNSFDEILGNGYSVIPGFLSPAEVKKGVDKIKALVEQKAFKKAGIGKEEKFETNAGVRSDSIFWLEKDDDLFRIIFFEKIDVLVKELNRNFYMGLQDYEFHLAHYPKGAFYKRHKDVFKSDDARKMSVICYLNPDWKKGDGGELKLFPANSDPLTIEPLQGKLVIFESSLEHEVLMNHADRYSITGWLKNKKSLL